ncbi:uncharacterized protein LOC132886625 isoform X3 [Neoarius graeffei]|uniref:uncharacterized protein LOC132886625 isoform X3 n=1 Tax=Neoarius graeffei TaxID=443677 RepID=UPI00298C040F|nr:uncharacterized protein LOC132886625 isoform X3 [Neoarius graeffei]
MPEFSQCAWWMFFISILVPFLLCGGRSGCSGHQHPNGTVTFNLDETVPVSQHDTWQINNVVQADEMSFNTTTIESRGLRYVTFKKCYENVTYWSADPGKSISCLCNCSPTVAPIQARNGDNSSVLDVIGRHDPHSNIRIGVIAASILCAVALLCIGCRYWKRKRHQR